jgi:hypothetical protein
VSLIDSTITPGCGSFLGEKLTGSSSPEILLTGAARFEGHSPQAASHPLNCFAWCRSALECALDPVTTRAKVKSGAASPKLNQAKLRKLSQPTAPKPAGDSAYEASRIAEIEARAALYRLRLEKQQAELLDARLLRTELGAVYAAIRAIILATRMTDREKHDCLRNLRLVDEIFAHVISIQNAELRRFSDGNGKSHHSEDEFP